MQMKHDILYGIRNGSAICAILIIVEDKKGDLLAGIETPHHESKNRDRGVFGTLLETRSWLEQPNLSRAKNAII